MTNIIICVKP